MSQSVQEVLNAITEASAALNREPQYRSQIADLTIKLNDAQEHNQHLELNIISYETQISQLNAKVRSLEVERDDFGFREMEANDKLDALRNVVKTFTAKVDEVMPVSVPIEQAPSLNIPPATPPAWDEVKTASAASGSSSNPPTEPYPSTDPTIMVSEEGQSESPLPQSASMTESQPMSASQSAPSTDAAPSLRKPYEGKTYTEVCGPDDAAHVTQSDWLEGGGSLTDYWK